eukprot:m.110570 g.110570  ORF g.110570 m.110570 type:complete len:853 (+) comp9224_c1_seq2:137-2695(+)
MSDQDILQGVLLRLKKKNLVDRRLRLCIVEWNGKGSDTIEDAKASKFCVSVCIDGYEIGRTEVTDPSDLYWYKCLNVTIPEDFDSVTAYLHQYHRGMDRHIGKVVIPKEEVVANPSFTGRKPLQFMTSDIDISGKINLDLDLTQDERGIWVVDALLIGGAGIKETSLFVVLSTELNAISGEGRHTPELFLGDLKERIHKSKVFHDSKDPVWCERFRMTLDEQPKTVTEEGDVIWSAGIAPVIRLSVWKESSADESCRYSGTAVVPITSAHLHSTRMKKKQEIDEARKKGDLPDDIDHLYPSSEWFALCNRQEVEPVELGNVQIKYEYTELKLLPNEQYKVIVDMLMCSLDKPNLMQTPVGVLAHTVKSKDDLAKHLLHLFFEHDKGFTYLKKLIDAEVASSKSVPTLFRGNSLMTKSIDYFMRLIGPKFLSECLAPVVISKVIRGQMECEINPAIISNEQKRKENMKILHKLVNDIILNLNTNLSAIPPVLQHVLHYIVATSCERFPELESVRFTSVSGFIFLRFFAPAILNPHLYGLSHLQTPPGVKRTLVLLSKTIQTFGNLGGEKGVKEDYMHEFYQMFDDRYNAGIQNFLSMVSCKPATSPAESFDRLTLTSCHSKDDIIKQGLLTKRGQGRKKNLMMGMSLSGLKNMKRRFVILTNSKLSYHKTEDTQELGFIESENIMGVERVQEEAFGVANAFQIIHKDSILYLIAETPFEQQEWIEAIRNVCKGNKNLQSSYHPGMLLGRGVWSCCEQKDLDSTIGCRPCAMVDKSRYPPVETEVWENPTSNLEKIFQLAEAATSSVTREEGVEEAYAIMEKAVAEMRFFHDKVKLKKGRPGSKYNPLPGLKLV